MLRKQFDKSLSILLLPLQAKASHPLCALVTSGIRIDARGSCHTHREKKLTHNVSTYTRREDVTNTRQTNWKWRRIFTRHSKKRKRNNHEHQKSSQPWAFPAKPGNILMKSICVSSNFFEECHDKSRFDEAPTFEREISQNPNIQKPNQHSIHFVWTRMTEDVSHRHSVSLSGQTRGHNTQYDICIQL